MANMLMNHGEIDSMFREWAKELNQALKEMRDRTATGLFIADQMDWEQEEFDDVA